jgi:20S proteasome alpha/beta subunit
MFEFITKSREEMLEEKRNLTKKTLSRAPVGLGMVYNNGILFMSENQLLGERMYNTDPVLETIGYIGSGSAREVQKLHRLITNVADSAALEYGRKRISIPSRSVTARFIGETYIVPEFDRRFRGELGATNFEISLILGDVHNGEFYTIFFDGSPESKRDFASVGADADAGQPNRVEQYLRDGRWNQGLSLEDALALGTKALAFGTGDRIRDGYIEAAVLDRTIAGEDKWAPLSPARGSCYARSPVDVGRAREIIRSALD